MIDAMINDGDIVVMKTGEVLVPSGYPIPETAALEIAAGAPPGRRCIRVLNEGSGLTNMAWFVVGSRPEVLEAEPNSDAAKP
mgnify:CR=1 FL=1